MLQRGVFSFATPQLSWRKERQLRALLPKHHSKPGQRYTLTFFPVYPKPVNSSDIPGRKQHIPASRNVLFATYAAIAQGVRRSRYTMRRRFSAPGTPQEYRGRGEMAQHN